MQTNLQTNPTEASAKDTCVYAISGFLHGVNDRQKKLETLRPHFRKLVMVRPGEHYLDTDQSLRIVPAKNPTGILRVLGMPGLRKQVDRWLYFPSPSSLFVRRAKKVLLHKIRQDLAEGKAVTVLIAAPPHGLFQIGKYLKEKAPQISFVADWQDLWSYDKNYLLRTPKLMHSRVKRLEKKFFDVADVNLTTNRYAQEVLVKNYMVPKNRTAAINHHFDESEIEVSVPRPANPQEIRIGFLGTLHKPPRVDGLVFPKVLEQLRREGLNVSLHVHGKAMETQQFDNALVWHGAVPHEQAVQLLPQYDFLFLTLSDDPNSQAVMSIKLPHYFLSGRPIIALVPKQSAVADMIRATGTGFVLPIDSDWQPMLRELLETRCDPERQQTEINKFSWRTLSKAWLDILTACGRLIPE